jgi:hypothetical protein
MITTLECVNKWNCAFELKRGFGALLINANSIEEKLMSEKLIEVRREREKNSNYLHAKQDDINDGRQKCLPNGNCETSDGE